MTLPKLDTTVATLHGVDVSSFVALFKKKRHELYLSRGPDASIHDLTEWAAGWQEATWPGEPRCVQLQRWYDLLCYVGRG